jgi:hypothetical protein
MWIQLAGQKQIFSQGKPTVFYPGDWVDVGRQTALAMVMAGEAVLPNARMAEILPGDAGVLMTGRPEAKSRLQEYGDLLAFAEGAPCLPWEYNAIWDGEVKVPRHLVLAGLGLLEMWQVAVPVADFNRLAAHAGSEEDRALTAAVLPDLRVPVYASGLLFARRCEPVQELLDAWAKERGDRDLAFLRALYRHPLLVLGLPTVWAGRALR